MEGARILLYRVTCIAHREVMQRRTRRIIFYALIAAFLVAGPLLVARAIGYTIDLKTWALQKSGGIFVKSKTARLAIFLDGALARETSPLSGNALLTHISPQPHLIRLEKSAHHPWSKTVTVEPAKVVELRNITLIPNPVPIATSTDADIISALQSLPSPFALALSAALPKEPSKSRNNTKLPPPLELDKEGTITVSIGTTTRILASHIHSLAPFEDTILFVDKNGFLARLDPATYEVRILGRPGFYLEQGQIQFIKSPAGEIILLDPSGGLFILDDALMLTAATGGVSDLHFDLRGEKIALAKTSGVEVLWRIDNPHQPFQKKGAREVITRGNAKIKEVRWFYGDNAHLLIRTNEGIFFTELDGRGGRNTVELVSGATDALRTTPDVPHTVFFKQGKEMFKIEL